MTKHRVFIFQPAHPTRKIIEIDALILTLEKRTWAETPSGRRHQLGTSAFYTLQSAERAKRGALQKIIDNKAMSMMRQTAGLYELAQYQAQKFDLLGTFNPKGKPN